MHVDVCGELRNECVCVRVLVENYTLDSELALKLDGW